MINQCCEYWFFCQLCLSLKLLLHVETLLMVNFGQKTAILRSWYFATKKKKPPKLPKYNLKPLLVSKKLPRKKLKPLLVSRKVPKFQFCHGNSYKFPQSKKFQILKFWKWAVWNKFELLKCGKILKFLVPWLPIFIKNLLLEALFLSENHEKLHFFRFVKSRH